MNRLALHESSAPHLTTHDLISAAALAGFDSIGLRVTGRAGSASRWRKGAGSAELRETIDHLLVTRVSVLDVGRACLLTDRPAAELTEAHRTVLDLGVRLGAHWATACPIDDTASVAEVTDLFARFATEAAAYQIRPLLVVQRGTAVDTIDHALSIVAGTGGEVVDEVTLRSDATDIDNVLVESGLAIGYLRLRADELEDLVDHPDEAAGLLATVPPHIPIAVGATKQMNTEGVAELAARARRWRHTIDLMLEHPRAREARQEAGQR